MALARKARSKTSASVDDLLSVMEESNNNNNLNVPGDLTKNGKWKSPAKETVSSRQRREMNAGKGIRMRSRTVSADDDTPGASSWAKEKLMEQKRLIKQHEDEMEELKKKNKEQQDKLEKSYEKINELIQINTEKSDKIETCENEKTQIIHESEDLKTQIIQLRQKIRTMQTTLENKDNTLNMCQKISEEKDVAMVDLNHMFEKEQKEKIALASQYSSKLTDQQELNKTLQREIELLKQELDRQLETSTNVKNELELELKAAQDKSQTLFDERSQYEEACQKYESEISERIRENLHIMEDYDKSKVVEHKQLSFINELTKSNQDLTTTLRKIQTEFEEIKIQLQLTKSEVVEAREHQQSAFQQLEDEKKTNRDLESNLQNGAKTINEQDQLAKKLQNEIDRLKAELAETTENLQEITNNHREVEERFTNLESETTSKSSKAQEELDDFVRRDHEQTNMLNKLVNDLEDTKHDNELKTELAKNLQSELQEIQERSRFDNENQLRTIRDLEKQVFDFTNSAEQQAGKMNKLEIENQDLSTKMIQCIENIGSLKIENGKLQSNVTQLSDANELLQSRLDDLTVSFEEKENECQDYQDKIELLEESGLTQDNIVADVTDQNEFMNAQIQDLEQEVSQLKIKIGTCVEKHSSELTQLQDNHKQNVSKLTEELNTNRHKSQSEINELLNNFNEVENELSFCQDELVNKTKELNDTRDQLTEMSNAAIAKEQKLLTDLETLNEQNENILQTEIRKFKKECDDKVMILQSNYNAEMIKLQNEFQGNMSAMKQKHEAEVKEHQEQMRSKLENEGMVASAEKEKLQEKYTKKSADYDRVRTELDTKMKSKDVELTSKSRIVNQLGRRIETQQKLIDYMMKSLEAERTKNHSSNNDVMFMLANLQSSLDDKLQQNPLAGEIYQYRQSLSSASSFQDLNHSYPQPLTNSSPRREMHHSTTEPVYSPIPSPTPSPMVEKSPHDDFNLYLRRQEHPSTKPHNQTFPSSKTQDHPLNTSSEESKLSKSLPAENVFVDHGYVSPTLHNNSTKTVYFGEQIQTIMKTFEKLESISETASPNKELNMEIWKQKIHFRLKVLEDQMDEIDDQSVTSSNSNASDSAFDKPNPLHDQPEVVFHPSTREIRELIENVNRRYKRLGRKYLNSTADEL
ncbi:putative leucine-rich repeat-containing protein DDB_G0290503 [Clytia hemisphaerica]|uniref:Cullin family profile domain-containing protein n=1 Tax=Clytia hemisphaerica TaxID=252671 RepID=A0A7M5XDP9_9CNID